MLLGIMRYLWDEEQKVESNLPLPEGKKIIMVCIKSPAIGDVWECLNIVMTTFISILYVLYANTYCHT